MTDQSVKMVLDKLDELVRQAGGLGEQAWPVLVKQAQIDGWVNLIIGLISVGLAVVICVVIVKFWEQIIDHDAEAAVVCVGGVIVAVFVLISMPAFGEAATQIFNPEYYAIQELLAIIK